MKGKTKAAKRSTKKATAKGDSLVCVPCGREVIVSNWGISEQVVYCCGKAMGKK